MEEWSYIDGEIQKMEYTHLNTTKLPLKKLKDNDFPAKCPLPKRKFQYKSTNSKSEKVNKVIRVKTRNSPEFDPNSGEFGNSPEFDPNSPEFGNSGEFHHTHPSLGNSGEFHETRLLLSKFATKQ